MLACSAAFAARGEQPGSIRGVVTDKDFDVPLATAQVTIVELGAKTATSDQGHFVFEQVAPGKYTLVFSKEGYVRQVKADVLVTAGQLTDVDVALAGEFTDLDEFVVQDILQLSAGSEASLLKMRFESPALMDSIGSELMSRAGAGDAASALRLVAGATVQNGKSAVIRGLPDRYVVTLMNGVRLPTADENKRAVELDQYPASVLESLQITKTFTPDQQGDASGGSVDVRLKGVPDEPFVQFSAQTSYNSQVRGRSDFLSYDGGGVNDLGTDDGSRDIQYQNLGKNWTGAVGTSKQLAPINSKWGLAFGKKYDLDSDVKIGGFASLFYQRDSTFYDNGIDDSKWVTHPGDPMTPQTFQGTPQQGDFKTGLFDVTRASQSVNWGALTALGLETENHQLGISYLATRTATDTATLSEDTRGKAYFFPGYDPNDPNGTGNDPNHIHDAPYLRLETLDYTERTTGTVQLHGRHKISMEDFGIGNWIKFHKPEVDWTLSDSTASLDEPDKRQFGALWLAASFNPGVPPFIPPFTTPPTWYPYKPAANFNLGNLQRIWKTVDEESKQLSLNLKLPFKQWIDLDGYWKSGFFGDQLRRDYTQQSFSNFGDSGANFLGGWEDFWSRDFPSENHPITASTEDVNYRGDQRITAWYSMLDMPMAKGVDFIGGARFESTDIGIVNFPEADATWFPPGADAPVKLNPGDADVDFHENDVLPSLGLVCTPIEQVTMRAAFSQTVARQTFKELSPIIQEEYLGGPIFIGNPDLQMSRIQNYDLRVDYKPYETGLLSASWFDKELKDPIEYEQRISSSFDYTTAVNYPEGQLSGIELEARQDLSHFADALQGFAVGTNATVINSEVTLPPDEQASFNDPGVNAPMSTRDMLNAPDHLYNFYATYDSATSGTKVALFYTVQGDTLIAGAGVSKGNFVPSVYALEYGTLNLSFSQSLGKYLTLQLQAKNLTNPYIEQVYRSPYIGGDVARASYTKGIDFSISLSARFGF